MKKSIECAEIAFKNIEEVSREFLTCEAAQLSE